MATVRPLVNDDRPDVRRLAVAIIGEELVRWGDQDLVYELDRVDHPSEALLLLHSSESRDPELRKFLWPVALSFQPVDRDARDPAPPRFLQTSVGIDLEATAGNDARLVVEGTFVPLREPIRAFRLDLNDTWYAASGTNLATRAEKVVAVTDEQGRRLAFDHRGDELVVELAEPAGPDVPVRLRFGELLPPQGRGAEMHDAAVRFIVDAVRSWRQPVST